MDGLKRVFREKSSFSPARQDPALPGQLQRVSPGTPSQQELPGLSVTSSILGQAGESQQDTQDAPASRHSPQDTPAARSSALEQHSELCQQSPAGSPCTRRTELARKESFPLFLEFHFMVPWGHTEGFLWSGRTHAGGAGL